jgi:hypothetical protein
MGLMEHRLRSTDAAKSAPISAINGSGSDKDIHILRCGFIASETHSCTMGYLFIC